MTTIWTPQPKQAEFMARGEFEALYGGAAGGGKSEALVMEALRQVNIPHYKALIMRKTYPQLNELIDKSLNYYQRSFPKARYNSTAHIWTFPSGAKVRFGAMQYKKDRVQYQGQAFDYIGFDELTHFTWEEYSYMFSRCRPNGPGTQCYIRATANPGGIGHGWVKERFITAGTPLQTIWQDIQWIDPEGRTHKRKRSRVFIPSNVFDNRILMENDPDYIANLAALPPAERDALLYGDWNSFSGQVFIEWKNDPSHYDDREDTHVIAPFKIPKHWPIWVGLDWGYTKPFSVHWYAIGDDRTMYCIRELYGCTGQPNVGVQWEPTRVAEEIKRIEDEDPNIRGHQIFRVGDPAIWASQGTESIGALMERKMVYFEKGNHDRLNGKMQCHHRLAFDEYNRPMFQVFDTCRHFIRTVPNLVYDETNVEDIDTDGEDHIYDEWRYVCMRNPIPAPKRLERKFRPYDPLDPLDDYYGQSSKDYSFYQRY